MFVRFINRIFDYVIAKTKPKTVMDRDRLQKNFINRNAEDLEGPHDDVLKRRNQSMRDSQGVSDFSGSAYNGPGNVDREKTNSNMAQRNF